MTTKQNAAILDQDSVAVLENDDRVAAILSPLRRQILRHLHQAPDSATGLARKMALPRQKLNYHLRDLERTGFLKLAEKRQRRGCVERTLRPTAQAYLISSEVLGDLAADPEEIRDRFSSSYLIALAGRLVRDVTLLRRRATRARKKLATFSLPTDLRFKNARDRAPFAEERAGEVARRAAKYHDGSPGSRAYRFVVGGHPLADKKREELPKREARET